MIFFNKINKILYFVGNKGKWRFGMLCFLETPVLRFAVLPYYRLFEHRYCLRTDIQVDKIQKFSLFVFTFIVNPAFWDNFHSQLLKVEVLHARFPFSKSVVVSF